MTSSAGPTSTSPPGPSAQATGAPAAHAAPDEGASDGGVDIAPDGGAKSIVLVGLMGVGKTSVGKRLASRLGWPFVDADSEIENAAGRTVTEIFADFGEAAFRDGERKVIARILSSPEPLVLATGGGAFVDNETRALVLERAISIWLDAPTDVLVERTGRRKTRPLLQTGDPREILARLARERTPIYSQARFRIESNRGPTGDVVAAIIKEISGLEGISDRA